MTIKFHPNLPGANELNTYRLHLRTVARVYNVLCIIVPREVAYLPNAWDLVPIISAIINDRNPARLAQTFVRALILTWVIATDRKPVLIFSHSVPNAWLLPYGTCQPSNEAGTALCVGDLCHHIFWKRFVTYLAASLCPNLRWEKHGFSVTKIITFQ